jgi:hypothetical protein
MLRNEDLCKIPQIFARKVGLAQKKGDLTWFISAMIVSVSSGYLIKDCALMGVAI